VLSAGSCPFSRLPVVLRASSRVSKKEINVQEQDSEI